METIKVDMYAAMKSGDKDKAGALRTLFAKLKDRQINTRKDLTEKECISVIKTLAKQRQESIEMYERAGREGLALKEKLELDILNVRFDIITGQNFNKRFNTAIDLINKNL